MKWNPNISIVSVCLTVFSWLAWEKVVSLRALLSGQPGHILNQENKRNLKKLSEKLLSVMVKGAILTSRSEEAAPAFLCLVVATEQLYHRCVVFCASLEGQGFPGGWSGRYRGTAGQLMYLSYTEMDFNCPDPSDPTHYPDVWLCGGQHTYSLPTTSDGPWRLEGCEGGLSESVGRNGHFFPQSRLLCHFICHLGKLMEWPNVITSHLCRQALRTCKISAPSLCLARHFADVC